MPSPNNLLITTLLLLSNPADPTAGTQPEPAWQLHAVLPGENAAVSFRIPAGLQDSTLPEVSVPGAELDGVSYVPPEDTVIVTLARPAADTVSFDELLLDYGSGPEPFQVGPVEVNWLNPHPDWPLLPRWLSHSNGPPFLGVLLENTAVAAVELTGFSYAPAALATGELLVLRDTAGLNLQGDGGGSGVELPYRSGAVFDADSWSGPAVEEFSFSSGSLLLEPGGQLLLIAGPDSLTPGTDFNLASIGAFAPSISFMLDGGQYHLPLERWR